MDQSTKVETLNNEYVEIIPDQVEVPKGGDLLTTQFKGGIGQTLYGTGISNIATPYQSPNFKAGVSGWRLNSNGIIQAVGVEIAGEITITGGDIIAVSSGGTGASTLTGILKGNGTSAVTTISPLAGTKQYYVADSSGGAVTRRLTFTDGILTSES